MEITKNVDVKEELKPGSIWASGRAQGLTEYYMLCVDARPKERLWFYISLEGFGYFGSCIENNLMEKDLVADNLAEFVKLYTIKE